MGGLLLHIDRLCIIWKIIFAAAYCCRVFFWLLSMALNRIGPGTHVTLLS